MRKRGSLNKKRGKAQKEKYQLTTEAFFSHAALLINGVANHMGFGRGRKHNKEGRVS